MTYRDRSTPAAHRWQLRQDGETVASSDTEAGILVALRTLHAEGQLTGPTVVVDTWTGRGQRYGTGPGGLALSA